MKRWVLIVSVLVLAMMLAACGGDNDSGDNASNDGMTDALQPAGGATAAPTTAGANPTQGPTSTPVPTGTPRPPAPRSQPVPEGDPQQFEAPFSAGEFVRQSLTGSAVSPQTGGQRVTYIYADGSSLQLNVYRFQSAAEAARTVQFTLEASSIETLIDAPYYAPAVSFGMAQDRHGGTLAAWSRDEWAFIAHTTGPRAVLDAFLEVFPY